MNFFPFHLGDYAKATSHLSPTEDGIYMRLLRWYYTHEQPLPRDFYDVARLARATRDQDNDVTNVLRDFFVCGDDGWHQSRADREIAAYHVKAEASRANGRLSGTQRVPRG